MARLERSAVAAAVVGLALANGGYSARFIGAAGVVVWSAVLALVIGLRRPIPGLLAGWTIATLIGLALLSAVSMAWASDGGAAFVAASRASLYAGVVALVAIAVRDGEMRPWLEGLAIGAGIVGLLALGSRLDSAFPGSDNEIARFLPSAAGRLSYPIGYWNGLAALMAAGIVLLAHLAAEARTRGGRAAATAMIPIEALVIYYASSRGGVIAAGLGLVVVTVLTLARTRLVLSVALAGLGVAVLVALASRRDALLDGLGHPGAAAEGHQMLVAVLVVAAIVALARLGLDGALGRVTVPSRFGRGVAVCVCVAALAGIVAANPSRRLEEFKQAPAGATSGSGYIASHLASGSGSGRWQYWSAARTAFASDPVHGIGAGAYESWWNQHGTLSTPAKNAHSLFLETLAELGLLGVALPIAFFVLPAIAGARLSGGALRADAAAGLAVLAAGAVSAAIDWTFQLPAVFAPVLVAAGALTALAGSVRLASAARIMVAGFAVAAIWAGALLFASEQRTADSQADVRSGDLAGAAQAAADAGSLEPWAAGPKLQLALVQELAGDLDAARASIRDAISLAPQDWRLRLVEARLSLKAGNVAAGRAALSAARALNPNAPIFAARAHG